MLFFNVTFFANFGTRQEDDMVRMSRREIALVGTVVLLSATVIFLGKEMTKKFGFMRDFLASSQFRQDCELYVEERGMHNVVITSLDGKPFTVLLGFELEIPGIEPGFDYYGCLHSNQNGKATFAIWMKSGQPLKSVFVFNREVVTNQDEKMVANFHIEVGPDNLVPDVVYPPHWWQKYLHLWG